MKTGLHPDLEEVSFVIKEKEEGEKFQKTLSKYPFLKICVNILLRVIGMKHYNAQGYVGYHSYLFSKKTIKEKLLPKNTKTLLDIGAGDGSITEQFTPFVEKIYFLEPAMIFQKKLLKKGFFHFEKQRKYEVITLLNVLDVCKDPEELILLAKNSLGKNGRIIISLPFPLQLRMHDKNIKSTNNLWELSSDDYISSVNDFYQKILKPLGLQVIGFAEVPYYVRLGDVEKPLQYRNGVFVCTAN